MHALLLLSILGALSYDTAQPNKCAAYVFVSSPSDFPPDPVYTPGQEKVFWVSPSADPGDKVLVKGAFVDAPKQIRLTPSGRTVSAENMGGTGFSFTLPADLPAGQYSFTIDGTSLRGRINRPEIYWAMGIAPGQSLYSLTPDSATVGDTLIVAGLNFPLAGNVLLTDEGGKTTTVSYRTDDAHELKVLIPPAFSSSLYNLRISAASSPDETASDPLRLPVRGKENPLTIKTIPCTGLSGDGKTDNTAALNSLLKANTARGFAVHFSMGAGTYVISGPITLMPNEYLDGAGEGVTVIKGNAVKAPDIWIRGTHHFGLSGMTVIAPVKTAIIGNFPNFYQFKVGQSAYGYVRLDHVRIQSTDNTGGGQGPTAIQIGGPHLSLTHLFIDNSRTTGIYSVAMTIAPSGGALLSHIHLFLKNGGTGMFIYSYHDVLMEYNDIDGGDPVSGASGGTSLASAKVIGSSTNILVAHNTYKNITIRNREGITTDIGGGTYLGAVAVSTPAVTTLKFQPNWGPDAAGGARYMITITAGTGVGQYRYVTSAAGNEITVDHPWALPPDAHSLVSISLYQQHIQIVRNTLENTGYIQFYGGVFDSQIEGNSMHNSLGLSLFSGVYFCACQPVENVVLASNSITGFNAGDANDNFGIKVMARNTTSISGALIHKNQMAGGTRIDFPDGVNRIKAVLFEKNAGNVTMPDRYKAYKSDRRQGLSFDKLSAD